MNENHSDRELIYRPRWLTPLLQVAAQEHRIIVITGARQVGKSTLLQQAEPMRHWRYCTLDDFDVLSQAERDPFALWAGADTIVLDEVQKAPRLLSAVKQAVDKSGSKVRFALTGSANLLLMRQISESLAGRAIYFVLGPMAMGEAQGQPAPSILSDLFANRWPSERMKLTAEPLPLEVMLRGLMPPLLRLSRPEAWTQWWEGYVTTYLERDLRQLSQIDSLIEFRRVMSLAALRTGQLLNQTEIARDAACSQSSVHRYLDLLETTHLAHRLPAYVSSRATRIIKSPKWFWSDSGLAVFLAGYHDLDSLKHARELGSYFETFVYHHLNTLSQLLTPRPRLYYWRTHQGVEVDFVLEQGRRLLAFEVKLTAEPRFDDAKGLRAFLEAHSSTVGGVLIHTGSAVKWLGEKIIALPWQLFMR